MSIESYLEPTVLESETEVGRPKREFLRLPGMENRFNATAWELETVSGRRTCLLAREVVQAAEEGKPDVGKLVLVVFDEQRRKLIEKTVWEPNEDQSSGLLEDARVFRRSDGSIEIGFTEVENEDGNAVPYPAITEPLDPSLETKLPSPKVIKGFGKGQNLTAVGGEEMAASAGKNTTAILENLYAFRPEGQENNHRLVVFKKDANYVEKVQDLEFPKTAWSEWRMGTTIPPIWLSEREGVIIIHGIAKDSDGRFVYSIGKAKIERDQNGLIRVIQVAEKPLITPDDFTDSDNRPIFNELHPIRRVVYCCGGIIRNDSLSLYVNVGDSTTVEVPIPISEIIEDW